MIRILLLPGMDGTGRLFQPLLDALPGSTHVDVVRYPTDQQLHSEQLLDLVGRRVPTGVRHAVVAESFSGPLAIRYAQARGSDVAGLVLCATFVANPLPWWLRAVVTATGWLVFRIPPPRAAIRLLMLGFDAAPALVEEVRSAIREVRSAVLADRIRSVFRVDVSAELASLDVPVLYLAGARDRLVGARGLQGVLRARPETEVCRLDAPHLVLQAEPERAAQAILAFLQQGRAAVP